MSFKRFFKKNRNVNPFKALADMYRHQTRELDKKGHAENYKKCTEIFFELVNRLYTEWREESPVTFEDVEYLDGYYIFSSGTNSVVHFHIKECPGWKFAIWWAPREKKAYGYKNGWTYSGEFFTQFEETVDKFKPSRSVFCVPFNAKIEPNFDGFDWTLTDVLKIIDFIRSEPYLAFCRDYCGWDYNEKYHTREEAKEKYEEYVRCRDTRVEVNNISTEKTLGFVRDKIIPRFTGAEIVDFGDCCSPRYELIAPLEDNAEFADEPGFYGWFADDGSDKELEDEWQSLIDGLEKLADERQVWWSHYFCVHADIRFYNKEDSSDFDDVRMK